MVIDKFNHEGYSDPTTYEVLTNIHREEMAANKKTAYLPLVYVCSPYADNIEMDCQHFFRQIFLGYFPDIVQAFDTLGRNVYGDDYTSLHNPIVLSSVLLVYGMFHSTQIMF